MGCHILDPVFGSLALTSPRSVRSDGGAPNADNWGLDSQVDYTFPGTKYTTDTLVLHWYDGSSRPPAEVKALIGKRPLQDQGSIYIGEKGVLYSPYIGAPCSCRPRSSPGRDQEAGRRRPLHPVRRGAAGATARPRPRSTIPAR